MEKITNPFMAISLLKNLESAASNVSVLYVKDLMTEEEFLNIGKILSRATNKIIEDQEIGNPNEKNVFMIFEELVSKKNLANNTVSDE